jgi:hypothetical protein
MKRQLKKITHLFARRKLKRDLLNRRVPRETVMWSEARRVGVLFCAHTDAELQTAHEFIGELKALGKDVEYLGYIAIKDYRKKHKEIKDPHYIFDRDFDFFHRPKRGLIEKFYKQEFDLLLSLNHTNPFSLNYIASLSRARLRTGRYHPGNVNAYDFMIDDPSGDLVHYIDTMRHYLKELKK